MHISCICIHLYIYIFQHFECGFFEKQVYKCLEAYGTRLARRYCHLELRDFNECVYHDKTVCLLLLLLPYYIVRYFWFKNFKRIILLSFAGRSLCGNTKREEAFVPDRQAKPSITTSELVCAQWRLHARLFWVQSEMGINKQCLLIGHLYSIRFSLFYYDCIKFVSVLLCT